MGTAVTLIDIRLCQLIVTACDNVPRLSHISSHTTCTGVHSPKIQSKLIKELRAMRNQQMCQARRIHT